MTPEHAEPSTVEFHEPVWDEQADMLDDDPFGDDLNEQLAARAPRRWANRGTAVLAAAVLLGIGFASGAQVEKRYGQPAAAATTPATNRQVNPAAAGRGGQGAQNQGQNSGQDGSQGGGAPVVGTVKFVDGNTVYVTTPDGNVVTVRTDGSTQIQLTQPGTVKDLPVGATVTVTGRSSGESTVTATRIVKDR
jgi:hypothetical protein